MQKSNIQTRAHSAGSGLRVWLGIVLLGAGLSGHLFAAHGIGGYYIAYRDHIFGFVFLTVVSALIVAGLGWRFWKGRHDITVLVVGVVQALLGFMVYINRFNVS